MNDESNPLVKKRKFSSPAAATPTSATTIFYLNVGGTVFDVSSSTLAKIPFFEHLIRSTTTETTPNGDADNDDNDDDNTGVRNKDCWGLTKDRNDRYFVDRDGAPFADLLTFLRSGDPKQGLAGFGTDRIQRLCVEADYYAMTELVTLLQQDFVPPPRGAKLLGSSWVKCHPMKLGWSVRAASTPQPAAASAAGPESENLLTSHLIEYNSHPGTFEVKESGTYLALFQRESPMPHLSNMQQSILSRFGATSVLPHLYIENGRPGVDKNSSRNRQIVRMGDIDLRTEGKLNEDGVNYCTHAGVDIVNFYKRDMVAVAVSVPAICKRPEHPKPPSRWTGSFGITPDVLSQLALVQIKVDSLFPCRARLERSIANDCNNAEDPRPSQVAQWSTRCNDGLVTLSDNRTKISIQHSGLYLVCCQVAGKYASSQDNHPDGIRWEVGEGNETLWLEQNRCLSTKYRHCLLNFYQTASDLTCFDPMRKENFQLGRMSDILICKSGDELMVRSERNIIMNDRSIPLDKYCKDSCTNPEFMEIVLLQNTTEFRRFRSKKIDGDNEGSFAWQSIDDDDDDNDVDGIAVSSPPFVTLSNDEKSFDFHLSDGEKSIKILILSSFEDCRTDSLSFSLVDRDDEDEETQPQLVAYRANHTGTFLHINTIIEIKQNNIGGAFYGVNIPSEGTDSWFESTECNDFKDWTSMIGKDFGESVSFIKLHK